MILKFGRQEVRVKSLADASTVYSQARDAANLGASRWPTGRVSSDAGQTIGYVSYNGRIWSRPAGDWKPGDTPIYDNR